VDRFEIQGEPFLCFMKIFFHYPLGLTFHCAVVIDLENGQNGDGKKNLQYGKSLNLPNG